MAKNQGKGGLRVGIGDAIADGPTTPRVGKAASATAVAAKGKAKGGKEAKKPAKAAPKKAAKKGGK